MATIKRRRATFEQIVRISDWLKNNREECERSTEAMLQVRLLADTGIDIGADTVGELLKANSISRRRVAGGHTRSQDRTGIVARHLRAVMLQLGLQVPEDLQAVIDRKKL